MYVQRNHCCSGQTINITYSECVFITLFIQHKMRMHHIVICGRPSLKYFSTLSHKRHVFRKRVTEYKMCFLISSTTIV